MSKVQVVKGIEFNSYESVLNFMYFFMDRFILNGFMVHKANGEIDEYILKSYEVSNLYRLKYELLESGKELEIILYGIGGRFDWTIDGENVDDIYSVDDKLDDLIALQPYQEVLEVNDIVDEIYVNEISSFRSFFDGLRHCISIKNLNTFSCSEFSFYKSKSTETKDSYYVEFVSDIRNEEYRIVTMGETKDRIDIKMFEINKYRKPECVFWGDITKGSFEVYLDKCKDKIKMPLLDTTSCFYL